MQEKYAFEDINETENTLSLDDNATLTNNLHALFHRMENEIQNNLQVRFEKKLKALNYAEQRINRIGIENIRKAKMSTLLSEKAEWLNAFDKDRRVVSNVNHILKVRING